MYNLDGWLADQKAPQPSKQKRGPLVKISMCCDGNEESVEAIKDIRAVEDQKANKWS